MTITNIAINPGVPTIFSMYCTQKAPWSPPGLYTWSPINGVSALAKVIESHIITKAIPMNHFKRFSFL